jgi:hypothetical protein
MADPVRLRVIGAALCARMANPTVSFSTLEPNPSWDHPPLRAQRAAPIFICEHRERMVTWATRL